jgi:hypothetical protein
MCRLPWSTSELDDERDAAKKAWLMVPLFLVGSDACTAAAGGDFSEVLEAFGCLWQLTVARDVIPMRAAVMLLTALLISVAPQQ